jgi:hypothetical protein
MAVENLRQGSLVSRRLQDMSANAVSDGISRVRPEHRVTFDGHLQTEACILASKDILHRLLQNQV